MLLLHVNEKAPLFETTTDSGGHFSLLDETGKTNIVLYFYPKDFTLGCTKESCAFRDNWEKVLSLDATVYGISSDSVESHKAFKEENALPFTLLTDQNREIRRKYGIDGRFIPPRVTFVIDKRGLIRSIFSSQLNMSKHVENALAVLKVIESEKEADALPTT